MDYAWMRDMVAEPAPAMDEDARIRYQIADRQPSRETLLRTPRPAEFRYRRGTDGNWIVSPFGRVLLGAPGSVSVFGPDPADPQSLQALSSLLDIGIVHAAVAQSLLVIHSSAWQIGRGSVLAAGGSGTGKTTLSLAALAAGGKVVGDDMLFAGIGTGGRTRLRSFRRNLLLRGPSLRVIEHGKGWTIEELEGDVEGRWRLARDDHPERFEAGLIPDALWVVSVDRRLRQSRIRPSSQADTMSALLGGSMPLYFSRHFPRERELAMPLLIKIVEGTPGFRVRLGRDLMSEPKAALERLIEASLL
jgi:hypothetical protein